MSENVRMIAGGIFWLIIAALVALNADAFSAVIKGIGGTVTGVSQGFFVTSDYGGQKNGRLVK